MPSLPPRGALAGLGVALALGALAACSPATPSGPCQFDADCPAGDHCHLGQCYAPVVGAGSTSGGGSASSSGTTGSSGGTTGATSTGGGTGSTSGGTTGAGSSGGGSTTSSGGTTSGGSSTSGSGTSGGSTTSGSGTSGGSTTSGSGTSGGSTSGGSTSGGSTSGGSGGAPVTCSAPSTSYQQNGGSCGSERWDIKVGTDPEAPNVSLVPQPTTIQQLVSLPASPGGSCTRNDPTELTTFELTNVNLHFVRLEADSDYHLVASDGNGNTMIVEVPYPGCVESVNCSGGGTPFLCDITHSRATADAIYSSRQDQIGTVIGVGFFDTLHGQNGVAPNGIELHPVLALCFGQNCDPLQGY